MKRLVATIAVISFLCLSGSALTLSPEEALERAFTLGDNIMKAPAARSALSLHYTENTVSGASPALYVFADNKDGRFYILPADDSAAPVLGYSDSAGFDPDNMPPSMRWWLSVYAAEIEQASRNKALTFSPAPRNYDPIEPLLTTVWNQDEPFNNQCPVMGSSRAVTGCVATAMAQVMNYHRYPASGRGTNSYTLGYNNRTLSLDFASVTFDWADMLDSYNGSYTREQADAVAELMYACGVSVNMQYTPSASGAASNDVAKALSEYFGYDKAVLCVSREYYTAAQWEDLVYSQLTEYGPVQYSGTNNSSGHAFVCDGYNADGFFHFNWGWGGMSDGYFRLSALSPGQQGIGGSTAGYNMGQQIIINVSKPRAGSTEQTYVICPDGFDFENRQVELGGVAIFKGLYFNMSNNDISGCPGIRMTDASGRSFYATYPYPLNIAPGSGFESFGFYMPELLAQGTYSVRPGFRSEDGSWADAHVNVSYPQTMLMTVAGNMAKFSPLEGANISSKDLTLLTPLHIGSPFRLSATIANTGGTEFYGEIRPALIKGSQIAALGEAVALTVEAGADFGLDYVGSLALYSSAGTPATGSYSMCLVRQEGENYISVSNSIDVTLQAPVSSKIRVSAFAVDGNPDAVLPNAVPITATVECSAGYFAGPVTAVIFDGASGIGLVQESRTVLISAGESQTVHYSIAIPSPMPGKQYITGLYNGQSLISDGYITFTTAASGIATVGTASLLPYPNPTSGTVYLGMPAPADGALYTLDGKMLITVSQGDTSLDMSGLPAGLYLLRIGNASYRLLKK